MEEAMSQADANPTTFRALTPFKRLPQAHKTFLVPDDASAPHLMPGEYAVVDTTDRDPQNGELFLIQHEKGRREIVQARSRYTRISGIGEAWRPELVWWVADLRGVRRAPGDWCETSYGYVGLSDGPYRPDHLEIEAGRARGGLCFVISWAACVVGAANH
jgi:hypothetical protein